MKKSLFKNTIYKAILSFVNIVIPIFVGPYIVKLLDVDLYGTYNIVYSEFQVFLIFASFGIYTFGMREISKIRNDKKKVSQLFSNLFVISILSNLVVVLIYILYSTLSSNGIKLTLYFIMLIQFVGNIFYIEFINEALENYKFITIKTIIIKILYIISIFLFIRNCNDIISYAIVVSLTVFLNNIVSFIYAKKYIKFDFSNIKIKRHLKSLLIILIITNIDLLYSQLDRVMLGKYTTGFDVSCYYIPYFLVSTLSSVPYALINVSIPRLSYVVANETKEQYQYTLNKVISSLLFIIVPVCMGVLALANEVIDLYAGKKYLVCIPVLILACITRIFIAVESCMTHLVMYPNNKEKILLRFTLLAGLSNLVFNYILVLFKIITPFTSMFTTWIAEIILIIIEKRYIKTKLEIDVKVMSKQNILYMILSLCFIPISYLIKYINFGFYINIIIIIFTCVLLYCGVLYLKKDENIFIIIDKLKGFFRRKKNG